MTHVNAILLDGYPVTIQEQWFVDLVARGADWRMADIVDATGITGAKIKVNPKAIAYLTLREHAPDLTIPDEDW